MRIFESEEEYNNFLKKLDDYVLIKIIENTIYKDGKIIVKI